MIKHILVPVDFSACANNAMNYAGHLAAQLKAEVLLLHVYAVPVIDPAVPAATLETYLAETEASARKSLSKAAARFSKLFPSVTVKTACKSGFAVSEVVEYTRKKKTNLVVMGTTGASGMEELLVGSNTASVLEKAYCPVIAVPAKARFNGISQILYTTDHSISGAKALHQLIDFAKAFGAGLRVLHVLNEREMYTELNPFRYANMGKKFNYSKLKYDEVNGIDTFREVTSYMKAHRCEMVSMATHARGFFSKLFHRSLTKRMAYHTTIPLMSFRVED